MHSVEFTLLARLLHEERLMEAERAWQHRRFRDQQPRVFLQLRLWTGEHLVRLGNRLLTVCPPASYHTSVGSHAGTL